MFTNQQFVIVESIQWVIPSSGYRLPRAKVSLVAIADWPSEPEAACCAKVRLVEELN
jgi:hypothetical protein